MPFPSQVAFVLVYHSNRKQNRADLYNENLKMLKKPKTVGEWFLRFTNYSIIVKMDILPKALHCKPHRIPVTILTETEKKTLKLM